MWSFGRERVWDRKHAPGSCNEQNEQVLKMAGNGPDSGIVRDLCFRLLTRPRQKYHKCAWYRTEIMHSRAYLIKALSLSADRLQKLEPIWDSLEPAPLQEPVACFRFHTRPRPKNHLCAWYRTEIMNSRAYFHGIITVPAEVPKIGTNLGQFGTSPPCRF